MNRSRWLIASCVICCQLLLSCATTHTDSGGTGQIGSYGPLLFNRAGGGDFYVAQDGRFVPAGFRDGAIEIHLHGAPFQIGFNGEQLNVCLAQIDFPEVRPDPKGYRASCLSGPFAGARPAHSDALLVYSGSKWSDGNIEILRRHCARSDTDKGLPSGLSDQLVALRSISSTQARSVRGNSTRLPGGLPGA